MPESLNPLISVSAGTLLFGTVAGFVIPNTPAMLIASTVGALVGLILSNRKEPPSSEYTALLKQSQAILAALDTLPKEQPPIDLNDVLTALQTHQSRLDRVMTLTEETLSEVKTKASTAETSTELRSQAPDYTPLLEANQNSLTSIRSDLDILKNCLLDALIRVSHSAKGDSSIAPTTKIDIEIKYRDEQGEQYDHAIQIQDLMELATLHLQESERCIDTAFKSLAYSNQSIKSGDPKSLKPFILNFFKKIISVSQGYDLLREEGTSLNPTLAILDKLFKLSDMAHFHNFSGRPAAYIANLLKDTDLCLIYHEKYSSVMPYTIMCRESTPDSAELVVCLD